MRLVNIALVMAVTVLSVPAPGSVRAGEAKVGAAQSGSVEYRLVVVEQTGCVYCLRWDAEIAPIWPRTDEGARAPLRRVELRDLPDDVAFASPPRLTPTFVLIRDGQEVGRIEGYGGDELFWAMTERMLHDADFPGR